MLFRSVTYSDLFSVIGILWGSGNGSTTFNIPDLRDKFLRGSGVSRSVGSSQTEQNLSHNHSLTINQYSDNSGLSGSHRHGIPAGGGSNLPMVYRASCASGYTLWNIAFTDYVLDHNHDISHSHTADCSNSGGSELRPNNIAVLYVIQVFNDSSSGSQGLTEEQSIQLQKVSDFIDAIASNDYTKAFKFTGSDGREFYLTEELIKYCNQFK